MGTNARVPADCRSRWNGLPLQTKDLDQGDPFLLGALRDYLMGSDLELTPAGRQGCENPIRHCNHDRRRSGPSLQATSVAFDVIIIHKAGDTSRSLDTFHGWRRRLTTTTAGDHDQYGDLSRPLPDQIGSAGLRFGIESIDDQGAPAGAAAERRGH